MDMSDDELKAILERIEKKIESRSSISGMGVLIACLIAMMLMNGCLKGCSL